MSASDANARATEWADSQREEWRGARDRPLYSLEHRWNCGCRGCRVDQADPVKRRAA